MAGFVTQETAEVLADADSESVVSQVTIEVLTEYSEVTEVDAFWSQII